MRNYVLRLIFLLTMFVGMGATATADPILIITTNIPTRVDLSCSGEYYGVVTMGNNKDVIYHGSFTLAVHGNKVTVTMSDLDGVLTYENVDWKVGLLDELKKINPQAKKFKAELISDYGKETEK